jgi:hypothetical protein
VICSPKNSRFNNQSTVRVSAINQPQPLVSLNHLFAPLIVQATNLRAIRFRGLNEKFHSFGKIFALQIKRDEPV